MDSYSQMFLTNQLDNLLSYAQEKVSQEGLAQSSRSLLFLSLSLGSLRNRLKGFSRFLKEAQSGTPFYHYLLLQVDLLLDEAKELHDVLETSTIPSYKRKALLKALEKVVENLPALKEAPNA